MKDLIFKKNNITIVVIALALLAVLYWSADRAAMPLLGQKRLQVAVTIFPLYDIVRIIGGDKVDVELVLKPGNSLEQMDQSFSNVDLSKTETIFAFGELFDVRSAPSYVQDRIFIVDEDIDVKLQDELTGNPFYWLSLNKASTIADNVAIRLTQLDPKNAEYYGSNRDLFVHSLDELHDDVTELFAGAQRKKFAVYGYDWTYFAEDLGLEVTAFATPFSQVDAPDTVSELIEKIQAEGLRGVASDIYADPEPLLPMLSTQRFSILSLDVLGGVEDRLSYIDLMTYNARTIFEVISL